MGDRREGEFLGSPSAFMEKPRTGKPLQCDRGASWEEGDFVLNTLCHDAWNLINV